MLQSIALSKGSSPDKPDSCGGPILACTSHLQDTRAPLQRSLSPQLACRARRRRTSTSSDCRHCWRLRSAGCRGGQPAVPVAAARYRNVLGEAPRTQQGHGVGHGPSH